MSLWARLFRWRRRGRYTPPPSAGTDEERASARDYWETEVREERTRRGTSDERR